MVKIFLKKLKDINFPILGFPTVAEKRPKIIFI
jgi:hypothetical protein